MAGLTVNPARALRALRAIGPPTAALIRQIPNPDQPIPNSEWTVRDAAAHLIVGQRVDTALLAGEASPVTSLDELPALNAQTLAQVPERDPATLADQFEAARAAFLAAEARDSARPVPWTPATPSRSGCW